MTDFDTQDVELLLEAIRNRQKFPRSCVKAYERLGDAAADTTERLFFDCGGIPVWAAYVLTQKTASSTGHASGKAKRQRLLNRIDATTSESRRHIALQLAAAIGPDRERIEQLVRTAQHQPDRNRRLRPAAFRTSGGDSGGEEPEYETQDSQTDATGSAAPEAPEPQGREQVHRQASITECSRLFPPYLACSIRRVINPRSTQSLFAAVTLSIQSASLECQMKLEIIENKIEYIARELFGVHIETEAGSRYVYLMGSASTKAVPYPNLMLKGCRIATAYQILGTEIADSIFATPTHQLEIKEGRECSDCITMVIRQNSSESADIIILLPTEQGITLQQRLFGDSGTG